MTPFDTPDGSGVPAPDSATTPPDRHSRWLRLVLMVGGALAAPSLALAAFFLTADRDAAPAKQAGAVTTTTRRASTPAAAPATTTTTTAPAAAPLPPPRDPFAPLVSQAPAGGG